jgi:hypothetical protein
MDKPGCMQLQLLCAREKGDLAPLSPPEFFHLSVGHSPLPAWCRPSGPWQGRLDEPPSGALTIIANRDYKYCVL